MSTQKGKTEKQQASIAYEIAKTSDTIRKKYLALKVGKMSTEENLQANLRPIVEPLKQLVQNTTTAEPNDNVDIVVQNTTTVEPNDNVDIKETLPRKKKKRFSDIRGMLQPSPMKKRRRIMKNKKKNDETNVTLASKKIYNIDDDDDDDDDDGTAMTTTTTTVPRQDTVEPSGPVSLESSMHDIFENPETHREENQYLSENLGPLAHEYLEKFFTGPSKNSDNVYGVYLRDDKLMLGNSVFDVKSNDDVIVNGVRYRGTRGLYELIFNKIPDERLYTEDDKDMYKRILILSDAHRSGNHLKGNKGYKYTKIIGPMFSSRGGRGIKLPTFMRVSDHPIDYVHWDDPNELVDRLKLLTASRNAGHSNHDNEIMSIIEELREAGIIIN